MRVKQGVSRSTRGIKGGGVLDNLTDIVNKYFNAQQNEGEHHAVSLSGKDKGRVHNFTGPGTRLDIRIPRGDRPINDLDEAAMYHDMAYNDNLNQYRNSKDRKSFLNNVWKADDEFVKKAYNSKDDPLTGKVAGTLIKGKQLAEKAGLLNTEVFSGAGRSYNKHSDPMSNLRKSLSRRSRSLPPKDDTQVGGFPIMPLVSILSTIGPPIIEYLWDKVHNNKKGGYYYGGGVELDVEDKRDILIKELQDI